MEKSALKQVKLFCERQQIHVGFAAVSVAIRQQRYILAFYQVDELDNP